MLLAKIQYIQFSWGEYMGMLPKAQTHTHAHFPNAICSHCCAVTRTRLWASARILLCLNQGEKGRGGGESERGGGGGDKDTHTQEKVGDKIKKRHSWTKSEREKVRKPAEEKELVTGRMISSFNQASWITAKINQIIIWKKWKAEHESIFLSTSVQFKSFLLPAFSSGLPTKVQYLTWLVSNQSLGR